MRILILLLAAAALNACSYSAEDHIETLAFDPDNREAARQELLLAKERSIEPLLEALAKPEYAAVRGEIAAALLSLSLRVEDDRIHQALSQHLVDDEDPEVRARIAHGFGLQRRVQGAEALVQALEQDSDTQVRFEALRSLGTLTSFLTEEQRQRVDARARTLIGDSHADLRMEALIRVADRIGAWLETARNHELQAELAQAESLFAMALTYYPDSKRANYRLARFYLDNGRAAEGLQLMQEHGMLLDVPRLARTPEIDGRLDEAVWKQAARADSFYQLSSRHVAAVPSELRSYFLLGYTDEAFYVGFYGYDENPADLMVRAKDFDDDVWWEDVIEIFFDANLDRASYMQVGITSVPVVADKWYPEGTTFNNDSSSWNATFDVATHVGADFWSIEYAVRYAEPQVPRPTPGDLWGFNLSRTYRNSEYAQWVRTSGAHSVDEFGMLRFVE